MGVHFTPEEGSTLYRLWAENTNDIILKTDCSGNILSASPGLEQVPFADVNGLFGRHILDLVQPSRAAAVMAEHESAIAGRQDGNWVEFPARTTDRHERWFVLCHHRCCPRGLDQIEDMSPEQPVNPGKGHLLQPRRGADDIAAAIGLQDDVVRILCPQPIEGTPLLGRKMYPHHTDAPARP